MQLINALVGVRMHMGLQLVHCNGFENINVVTPAVVMKGTVLHMALKIAGCIFSRPAEQVVTKVGHLSAYLEEICDG